MTRDKQLRGITFADVLVKSRRGQALNAKEFAVLAGISYSSAREWFQLSGFPRIQGVVFWQDFVEWRKAQSEKRNPPKNPPPQPLSTDSASINRLRVGLRRSEISPALGFFRIKKHLIIPRLPALFLHNRASS